MTSHTPAPSRPDLLRQLDESLSGLTGQVFFQELVQVLSSTLDAHCAFVCEFLDGNARAKPFAFRLGNELVEVGEFALAGTPCERVLSGDIIAFDRNVAALFPYDREALEALGAESYVAIPMANRGGRIIGHIAVIDVRARDWAEADLDVLKLCARRASGELEHVQIQRALGAANQALEDRVRERTHELERARDEMEQRVAERTASLSAVNARLRHEIAARLEAEQALRRQEEAYRDLYEHAPNVYWSTGADGLIKRINARAADLFGYPPEQLIGKHFTSLVADTPAGLPRARQVFQRFLEGESTFGEEFEFRAANGKTIWATVNVVPIFDDDGRPIATRTTLTDITERKRMEEALEQARAGAEAASQAKSEFLARMSHELRTPLNAILGYAQLMQRDEQTTPRQHAQLETVRRSGEHLLALINEVLDLARVEAGKLEIRAVDLDLGGLARDIESMFRPRAENAGLVFRCEVAKPYPARIKVDDRRLRQILINLLGNAVKFTPPGGTITLRIKAAQVDRSWTVVFEVEDTGIGIAPDKLERIFEPFYQVDAESGEGIGLGLAITRRLVEAMAGELSVDSEPGRGAKFRLALDVLAAAPGPAVAAPVSRALVGFHGEPRTVLIADDRLENRAVLSNLLQPLGFRIQEVEDGEAAVAAVERRCPDLLLIDLLMPKLNGFDAVRRIRGLPGAHNLKVVAISASVFEHTRRESLASGCDAFLGKPVDLGKVLGLMQSLLGLEWIYSCDASPALAAREVEPLAMTLPSDAVSELYGLAQTGDVMAINARLADFAGDSKHAAVLAHLKALTDQFDMRGVEQYLAPLIQANASSVAEADAQ